MHQASISQCDDGAPIDGFTGVRAAAFGIYVHFPYCLSKCPYCDFASTAVRIIPDERYTNAICSELEFRAHRLDRAERIVHSIYFGGGTPSLWQPSSVSRVLSSIAKRFRVSSLCEITLEANPDASDAARFGELRSAGVNRLSIGMQSFSPAILHKLGRAHDRDAAIHAFEAARRAGFENVSLDLIYGVHGQTMEQVIDDSNVAVSLNPDHVSAYALTLDRPSLAQEVPLARQLLRGEVTLPHDELVLAMQRAVSARLGDAGLHRYEISNYAKAGRHSVHNALYWTGGEYLAVGAGATGCVRRNGRIERYANHRSDEKYLVDVESGRMTGANTEVLTRDELFSERIAMGLRLTNGIDVLAACDAFGKPRGSRDRFLDELVARKLASIENGRIALTQSGMDLHSEIAARLI